MTDGLKPLSKKHQRVLDEYLISFVQWKAYQRVYRKANYDSARSLASDLFANANFSAHLLARLNEVHMSADEALKLHADIARGDIGDLLDNNGLLDIRLAKSNGMTKLLRKIKQKTITRIGKTDNDDDVEITEIEFEMYPADAAQERILKIHGKFTERVDVTTNGESLTKGIDEASFERAITTLTATLREVVPPTDSG